MATESHPAIYGLTKYWDVGLLKWVKGTQPTGGGGGGGAVTVADGADVAQGTTSDVAWVAGNGTVISLLKKIASAGGSAVSIADGADVAQGTTTDAAVVTDIAGTLSGKLRGMVKILADVWDSAGHRLKVDGSGVTQPVSGTFWQVTQPVSGTVTASPVTQTTAGPTSFTGTGSVSLALSGNTGVAISVTYTGATANVRVLVSYDGGGTYPETVPFMDAFTGASAGRQSATVTLETSSKVYTVSNLPGATHVRFDIASYTVGTILIAMRATNAVRNPELALGSYLDTFASVLGGIQLGGYASQPTSGATFYPVQIAGSFPSTAAIGLVVRDVQCGTSVPGAALASDFKAVGAYDLDTSVMRNMEMRESAPGGTDKGLVVRNIPSGTQTVSGTITANSGTNLNTSLLALEAGGNLASIKAKTDNIPALGQALAAASTPVVLTAIQLTTLTPPAAITGFNLEATQLLVKAKTDNLDVALSTRLKPADTLTGVTTVTTVTTITNPVTVTPPTLTKGTQAATGFSTQDLKDAGRNQTNWFMAAPVATTNAEVMQSLTGYKGGIAIGATVTPNVVTSGKTYRIQCIVATLWAVTAIGGYRITLRANLSGNGVVGSPLVLALQIGIPAVFTAGSAMTYVFPYPDGIEFAAGTGIAVGVIGEAADGTTGTAIGKAMVAIQGYEY